MRQRYFDTSCMSAVVSAIWMFAAAAHSGCTTTPIVTRTIYEDRSMWIRLEEDPHLAKITPQPAGSGEADVPLTSGVLAAWLKGFRVETDRGPIGMLLGRPGEYNAFVEAEIAGLTPQLAKALKAAGPTERVAYCMTVDYSAQERFITTGWVYVKNPHLYFKLVEYRTPVKVGSPAVSTKEACKTKPLPGVKTADRFFRLDYSPDDAVVKYGLTSGLMAGIDRNQRGEVVFKLTRLFTLTPPNQDASKDQRKVPDIIPSLNSSSNLGKEKLPKESRP
jgi:hypothetical protein